MKICVLYNVPGSSLTTIDGADGAIENLVNQIARALDGMGHQSSKMGITKENIDDVEKLQTDMVFNMVEWMGRDLADALRVLQILERRGIGYTGAQSEAYALSTDKRLMKQRFVDHGVSTPKFVIIEKSQIQSLKPKVEGLNYPVIVKPVLEHCSIGVSQESIVEDAKRLSDLVIKLQQQYDQAVVVEEFIEGDEAHVTVMEKNGKPWVLPPAVFGFKKKDGYYPIQSYNAKWEEKSWEGKMTFWMEVGPEMENKLIEAAERVFEVTKGKGMSRVDMRIDKNGEVFVLEINHNPGLSWDNNESGLVYSANKAGLTFENIIGLMVDSVS